jgi:DNA damage-binding protein 1
MSKYSYSATYYKSSAVNAALIANIKSPSDRSLCIAKGSSIEIYKLEEDTIGSIEEIETYSYITSLVTLKTTAGTDSLLVLTHSHRLWHISYNDPCFRKQLQDLTIASRPSPTWNYLMGINSSQSLLCVCDYDDYFRIIRIHDGKVIEKDIFVIDSYGLKVKDLCFLDGKDVIAFLFMKQDNVNVSVEFYNLSYTDKSYTVLKKYNFSEKPGRIISCKGERAILFLEHSYRVFNLEDFSYSTYETYFGSVTSQCRVDENRWIIGNDLGNLYFVYINDTDIIIKLLGNSSSSGSLVYLDNNIIFLGSHQGNSKLIRVLLEPEAGTYIVELQDIASVSPIFDLHILEYNQIGTLNLLTCSGTGLDGRFCKVSKAVTIYTECEMELANITGFWTININSVYHSHIIISFTNETRALGCTNSMIKPATLQNLITAEPTILISNHKASVIQIVPSGLYYFSNTLETIASLNSSEISEGNKIILGCIFNSTICIVLKSDILVCLRIQNQTFEVLWNITSKYEISCLGGFEDAIGVGYWEDNSISVLDRHNGNPIYKETNNFAAAPKSLKFVKFGSAVYMVVGIRNGYLVYYNLNDFTKSYINIGYQAVIVENFVYKGTDLIFAASDKCVFLYSERNKVCFCTLSCNKVSLAYSFHTESFPDCMIIATGKVFSVISFEDLQKYSVVPIQKQVTLIKVILIGDKKVVIALDLSKKYSLKVYDENYKEIQTILYEDNEIINTIEALNSRVYVGIEILSNTEADQNEGLIRIYELNQSTLILLNQLQSEKYVINISSIRNDLLIVCRSELHYYKLHNNSLKSIDTISSSDRIIDIDVLEDRIAVIGNRNYLRVFSVTEKKLLNIYKYTAISSPCAVKIISFKLIAVGDTYGNLLLFEPCGALLQPCSGINFEKQYITSIKSFKIPQEHQNSERNGIVYGTPYGKIGIIIELTEYEYKILSTLQRWIVKDIDTSHKFIENIYKPIHRKKVIEVDEFVNGDIIGKFLDMSQSKQAEVLKIINTAVNEPCSSETVTNLVFSLAKFH